MDHDNLSKVDQFKLLTETAAGTPMGTLLRKFFIALWSIAPDLYLLTCTTISIDAKL